MANSLANNFWIVPRLFHYSGRLSRYCLTAGIFALLGWTTHEHETALTGRWISLLRTNKPVSETLKKENYSRLRAPWPPEENALLGTMPDMKLARRLKRSYDAVAARRLNQGIPSCNPKRKLWRREDDQVLGTRPDAQIAMLLQRTLHSIRNRRRKLGIPTKLAINYKPWTKAEDRLLGTKLDNEVAHLLSRTRQSVCQRRRKLRIRPAPFNMPWTPRELNLVGTMPDQELARLIGRSMAAVRVRRYQLGRPNQNPRQKCWTETDTALLGKFTDREVSNRTGQPLSHPPSYLQGGQIFLGQWNAKHIPPGRHEISPLASLATRH